MNQEQQTASDIIRLLDASAAALPADKAGRLAEARQRAVTAFVASQGEVVNESGLLKIIGHYAQHHRAITLTGIAFAAAFSAFLITQQLDIFSRAEQGGDAFLLASELPPEAFLDKGFDAWLEASQR